MHQVKKNKIKMKTNALIYFLLLMFTTSALCAKFQVIKQWKYINFTWPSEDAFRTAQSKGLYVPENTIISGIKSHEDYFYITLPRLKSGVAATLARIPVNKPGDPSPLLEPYPNWGMNSVEDCNSLQNVQNVEIDRKGQMWIIDSGRVNTLEADGGRGCQPKLVIFDIKNNRTSTVYLFPEEVAARNGSYLYDLVVDEGDGYAYITDNSAHDPGIIVFSLKDNNSWKIRHARSMRADPSVNQFSVNNIQILASMNLAGIALGPKIHISNSAAQTVLNEDRDVYFAPISSLHLFKINTTTLRNENLAKSLNNSNNSYDETIKDMGVKQSQSAAMVMDNQGVLYFSLINSNAIGRWDSHTAFDAANQKVISRDNRFLEWPSGFTFDRSGNLSVVVNRLNKFVFDKIDLGEDNFRILSARIGAKSYLDDEMFNYDYAGGKTEATMMESHSHFNNNNNQSTTTTSSTPAPSSGRSLVAAGMSFLVVFQVVTSFW